MKTFVEREVLLQLKRVYNKDEVICELNRQLKEYGFKVGLMESQIAELLHENKLLKEENSLYQDSPTKGLSKKNRRLEQDITKEKEISLKFKKEAQYWMIKYINNKKNKI